MILRVASDQFRVARIQYCSDWLRFSRQAAADVIWHQCSATLIVTKGNSRIESSTANQVLRSNRDPAWAAIYA